MQDDLSLESYDYDLPQKSIAQYPSTTRDISKLLVLNRQNGTIEHRQFYDIIDYLNKNDILVINDTKVFPARLHGKKSSGGKVEIFLLQFPVEKILDPSNESVRRAEALALIKSSRRPAPGMKIYISPQLSCSLIEDLDNGRAMIELEYNVQDDLIEILNRCGSTPLPPYIERADGTSENDRERYQTVYAQHPGAVAAPTAGLHFTREILDTLSSRGIEIASITLHVGYGTFAPVRSAEITKHAIHEEYVAISAETAAKINSARKKGGRVWAVGTTTVRTLEFAAQDDGRIHACNGWCDLYIVPGYEFKVIDKLITNFHLPKSSLLFLVSALCGRKTLLNCYEEAIARDYRFYSYGDAMAII
ncbi:MAG: tRNA preQ1(34) S-adenosylmethionine ribosyltransferase-isomerase QueA [Desulfocapsaceae bacterium]|nr:tRNA preQ1(34) S-adenosylmethionine ribosyltransferase-isomerase QueA [Desulfocapsaceae bacterium]